MGIIVAFGVLIFGFAIEWFLRLVHGSNPFGLVFGYCTKQFFIVGVIAIVYQPINTLYIHIFLMPLYAIYTCKYLLNY